jgi:NAD-dependent DNA ligase
MLQSKKYKGMVGMEDKLLLMKEKIKLLNEANKAYYQEDREIMSNYEYDKLYDELKKMEEETGVVLSNSPTLKVGYELLSNLPKERHEKAMLSLDKTKEVSKENESDEANKRCTTIKRFTSPTISTTTPATATEKAMGTPNARHPKNVKSSILPIIPPPPL